MNDDIHDLSGAYALDALDDLERARFEQHLTKCAACSRDVAEFQRTTTHLAAYAAEAPPPGLRGEILSAVAQTRQERPAVTGGRPRRPAAWVVAVAGVAAALLIAVLGAQLVHVRDQRDRSDALASVLTAPDATVVPLEGDTGSGRMVWSPELGRSVLVLDGLPELASDRGYQLWFVVDGEPVPAEVYQPHGPRLVAEAGDVPDGLQGIGITEEPASGSDAPTSPMVLQGQAPQAS